MGSDREQVSTCNPPIRTAQHFINSETNTQSPKEVTFLHVEKNSLFLNVSQAICHKMSKSNHYLKH